jgi:methyl-accepting chemotaxis protein
VIVGGLRLDGEAHEATLDYRPLELSRREFDLLYYLAVRAGQVVTKRELLTHVWRVNQQNPSEPVTVFLPGGRQLGVHVPQSSGVRLAARGKSFSEQASGGVAIFVAVQGLPKGTAVIRTFVPDAQLRRGVAHAWLLLGVVAVGLLVTAVIVAAQLTRTLVRPLGNMAMAAEQLAAGDLTARSPVDGPPEIHQVSNGLNRLAARIGELLAHERETLADLSHRLRTR